MAGKINVGVIGFGMAARVFHCPFVSAVPGLELRSIVQRKGDEAAKAYPKARVLRSIDDLLRDEEIELVVVATPNETHYGLGRRALDAGKHVVIDKPLTATSGQARELINLANAKRLLLVPFHNRRWDGDFLTVRQLLEEGRLGRIVTVESHFPLYRPVPREGTWKEMEDSANGLLFDLGPHLVDQAFVLFGPPKTVTASIRRNRDCTKIDDGFDIALGYERLVFWCRSSLLACDPPPRFLIHGTLGSFKKLGVDPQQPALMAGAKIPKIGEGDWLAENEQMWGEITAPPVLTDPATLAKTRIRTRPGDYRRFYANLTDALIGTAKLEVSAIDGLNAIRTLELARESSVRGQTMEFQS